MRLRLAPCLAVTTLFLAACSSSDANPSTLTSKASESPEPSATSQPDHSSDEAFCIAIDYWDASMTSMGEGMAGLEMIVSTAEGSEEYPTPDAMHEFARDTIAAADDADGYLATAIANSSDAEVSGDLREAHDLAIEYARWIASVGLDAGDAMEFSTNFLQKLDRTNQFNTSLAAIDGTLAANYINSRCHDDGAPGRAFSPRAQDTDAKIDASTLGWKIATYYVDWNTGDPNPVIFVVDDTYELNGEYIADRSGNVELTDQYANGYTDWCVEVTNEAGMVKTFKYSAQSGLEDGTCQ